MTEPLENHKGRDVRRAMWRLLAISFVSLFWEVLLIRWIPSEVPFLSFFRSLVLLACFLGMGLGCIAYRRVRMADRSLMLLFLAGILLVVMIVVVGGEGLRARGFGASAGVLQQHPAIADAQSETPGAVDFTLEFEGGTPGGEAVILGAFALVTLVFVPIGVLLARSFEPLPPIPAYLVNILGALAGTAAFVGISLASLSPPFWFLGGVVSCAAVSPPTWKGRALFGVLLVAVLAAVAYQSRGEQVLWSPYQRVSWDSQYLQLKDRDTTERILLSGPIYVNYDYHQQFVNLAFIKDQKRLVEVLGQVQKQLDRGFDTPLTFYQRYNTPYLYIQPRRVLIIAAGNGNEAAAAIRHGAEEVDSVEIDPGIIEVGRRMHPEHPYDNPRVHVVCDDARAFLERTDKKYDLVVMNAVDSHSQFATSANLRLDSYIFTLEFFEQVRRHMAEGGMFALEFSGFHWRLQWSQDRLKEILWRAFGYDLPPPAQQLWGAGGPLFLIPLRPPPAPASYSTAVRMSTDDWPQFYLQRPMIPRAYLYLIGFVLAICAVGLLLARPTGMARVDLHFLLLGAAFMLLEIRSITQLSLLFGATWLVNSIVIAAILAAIGIANVAVLRLKGSPYWLGYTILFASLGAGMFFPPGGFLGFATAARVLGGCLSVALPVFGAGVVFGLSFRRAVLAPAALGWNLLGAMLGGLGEYVSLVTGVQALGFGIIGLYVLSLVFLRWSHLRS